MGQIVNYLILALVHQVSGFSSGELRALAHSRVVVIPDVHGDYEALLRSLWLAVKKVDKKDPPAFPEFIQAFESAATAGDPAAQYPLMSTTAGVAIVQLGDLVDRGPYGMYCMQLMQMVPQVLGWDLVQLYGNHEILNLLDRATEYVHPIEWAMFPDRRAQYTLGGGIHWILKTRFTSMARLTTSNNGNAGTLFVHGGVDMDWFSDVHGTDSTDVDTINFIIHQSMWLDDETDLMNTMDSIVWTRFLANAPEHEACALVDSLLSSFQVARIIVGHTPQSDQLVKTRCGGKIVLADVMMSRWMTEMNVDEQARVGGRPMALVLGIESENLESMVAHYIDLQGQNEEDIDLLAESSKDANPEEEIVSMTDVSSVSAESLSDFRFVDDDEPVGLQNHDLY